MEAFRNGMYKIQLDNGHETLGYTAGKCADTASRSCLVTA